MILQLIELKSHFRIKTTMNNGVDTARRGPVIQAAQRGDHHRLFSSGGIPPWRTTLQMIAKFIKHMAGSRMTIIADDKVGVLFTMCRKMDTLNGK